MVKRHRSALREKTRAGQSLAAYNSRRTYEAEGLLAVPHGLQRQQRRHSRQTQVRQDEPVCLAEQPSFKLIIRFSPHEPAQSPTTASYARSHAARDQRALSQWHV